MEKRIHPAVHDMKSDMEKGKLSRREFLRYSTLLGVSAFTATQMAGLSWTSRAFAGNVKRGGTLKVATALQKIAHPATYSWIAASNVTRQVAEYLTLTDGKNITHPYLLENWEASDDLKTWTLNVRKGVTFNNGDTFTADDVIFTINQWLDESVGSSMKGIVGGYVSANDIEKTSDYQVKLHLSVPEIAVPEHLFQYPAQVLNHKTFEGDFLKAPHGTGPYTLETYREGELAIVKARTDYWQKGADGKPLPYLDAMHFLDMGTETAPMISAIKSKDIDFIDLSDIGGTDIFRALKDDPEINILAAPTASARVLRMRVDLKPWDNEKVRLAMRKCHNHEKILALAYMGQGLEGQDFHVYQLHPEYCEMPIPPYDPAGAKKLLAEAGYPNGLEVNLAVGSGWPDVVRYAEVLKQDAIAGGFKINLQTMPNSQYWEKWTEVDFGITPWTHRPLGTMVLNLAYKADTDGKPVAWNETRWVDEEFSKILEKANGTLDVEKRRKLFCKLQKIQYDRGSIAIGYWRAVWMVSRSNVKGLEGHPNGYMLFNDVSFA
ncbi:MAG: ABC transporter substrate-binding protein [Desulfotignum sp.]|nr:ABC transporter substrate-binding protein [Desulfotignum sp.]MCF8126311.1 ABC transporter substrate-binding protein [Desulfotignum sp.]